MADITAPMGANVWKILVKEGDSVNENDDLMILEAMKMEIPIQADRSGAVTCLKVKEGDSVEADAVLLCIE